MFADVSRRGAGIVARSEALARILVAPHGNLECSHVEITPIDPTRSFERLEQKVIHCNEKNMTHHLQPGEE